MDTIEKDLDPESKIRRSPTGKKYDWPALVSAWKQSGMSQKEFCKKHALNHNSFVYYHGQVKKKANQNSKLIPVMLQNNQIPNVPTLYYFTLYYPNGTRLSIPRDADINTLKMILSCLGV